MFPSGPPVLIWTASVENHVPTAGLKISDQVLKLQQCYHLVTLGKFKEAIKLLRNILLSAPLLIADTQRSVAEVQQLLQICREYILGKYNVCH